MKGDCICLHELCSHVCRNSILMFTCALMFACLQELSALLIKLGVVGEGFAPISSIQASAPDFGGISMQSATEGNRMLEQKSNLSQTAAGLCGAGRQIQL